VIFLKAEGSYFFAHLLRDDKAGSTRREVSAAVLLPPRQRLRFAVSRFARENFHIRSCFLKSSR